MKQFIIVGTLLFAGVALATSSDPIEQRIKEANAQAKANGWTFKAGYSPILEIPLHNRTGLKRRADWKSRAPFISLPRQHDLPAAWDWRTQNIVTPIQNQGSCGSCWAFGTTASFESAITKVAGAMASISEEQVTDCDTEDDGCDGGDFAFDFWTNTGAAHKSEYPYVGGGERCKSTAPQHEKIASWAYVGAEDREPTTDEIKQAIYTYGPVAITVSAEGSFQDYSSGVYNACNSNEVDHIVALVGWDDSTKSWILKNSWGADWGENGYMRIAYTGKDGSKCNAVGGSAAYGIYTAPTK